MDFLKEHATILLAVFPVLIGFGGAWLGAKVQAGGGVAQAKAAKEAAETAAAATLQAVREQTDRAAAAAHAAALRDQRTSAITDFLRTVREFTRALDQLYREPDTNSVDGAHNDFLQAQGALELVAPTALTTASARVVTTTEHLARLASERAEAQRAMKCLVASAVGSVDAYKDLRRAQAALTAFRAAWGAATDDIGDKHIEVSSALAQIPELSSEQQTALIFDCMEPELGPVRRQYEQEHSDELTAFIDQARATLGIDD